jgi:hypothetical protein
LSTSVSPAAISVFVSTCDTIVAAFSAHRSSSPCRIGLLRVTPVDLSVACVTDPPSPVVADADRL